MMMMMRGVGGSLSAKVRGLTTLIHDMRTQAGRRHETHLSSEQGGRLARSQVRVRPELDPKEGRDTRLRQRHHQLGKPTSR